MCSWPNFYRGLADEARGRAARTSNLSVKDKLEEVAKEWSALAVWAELKSRPATANEVGLVHADEHRYAEACQAYEAALAIHRELAQANPAAYRPAVAGTLNNLGRVHAEEHRYAEARQAFEEALRIFQELAATAPAQFAWAVQDLQDRLSVETNQWFGNQDTAETLRAKNRVL